MGNKKYIMCSGLAFADEEDMEMLHEYAKEGWIFERLRFGVLYELQRMLLKRKIKMIIWQCSKKAVGIWLGNGQEIFASFGQKRERQLCIVMQRYWEINIVVFFGEALLVW